MVLVPVHKSWYIVDILTVMDIPYGPLCELSGFPRCCFWSSLRYSFDERYVSISLTSISNGAEIWPFASGVVLNASLTKKYSNVFAWNSLWSVNSGECIELNARPILKFIAVCENSLKGHPPCISLVPLGKHLMLDLILLPIHQMPIHQMFIIQLFGCKGCLSFYYWVCRFVRLFYGKKMQKNIFFTIYRQNPTQ